MDPWYKVATPRKEVREGRSFDPDEFAIALEQVLAGTAPEDYRDPVQFFARTCFTRALREHAGMVLRRLAGQTESAAPVLTLITQFGGGKTHTLTALYHLVRNGEKAAGYPGVAGLLAGAGLPTVPAARVAVFVGNAWDPREGRETPWLDLARQLAGDDGVAALGAAARTTPPGTEALGRLFTAGGGAVLILFDEVLNFLNRHRAQAEPFYAFVHNLTVAMTGTTRGAAIISLPRSQVEMTDSDLQWQERLTKVVRRVAKDLIANDESEISEVVRLRLFQDLGSERVRKTVGKSYADWCFERRAQLPPEWTAVDTAATEARARELLRSRFEACYPFHPATLSVFQRKWQALPQYQQTRGTLAMLAQWISWAYREGWGRTRTEPFITLGSAPLEVPGFRGVVLGQLGESRLMAAIEADIAGPHSHARALDVDTRGPLRDIHRRVATTILFESSGGQAEKVAHLPELRFALGEPGVDTTSVDNAALALEARAFFIRRVGSDGFQVRYKPTLKKVVSDRRASLDEETEIRPAIRGVVQKEFDRGASLPIVSFPEDGTAISDSARLTLIVVGPEWEWSGAGDLRQRLAEWTRERGKSPRLYPGALVWCVKKPGRDLRDKVELWLAWRRVAREMAEGTLGADFDRSDRAEIDAKVREAEEAGRDEVWGGYRYVVLAESHEPDGLKEIDLGAGHASAGQTLSGRIIAALKSQALLDESVGAGYIDRHWPPALRESGAWPLAGLRQAFLNGSLTRLLDADAVLRTKIVEFAQRGDFGLASGQQSGGGYSRVWFKEPVPGDEVVFDAQTYLLLPSVAKAAKGGAEEGPVPGPLGPGQGAGPLVIEPPKGAEVAAPTGTRHIRLRGSIPPEIWNRVGTKLLPKLRAGAHLEISLGFDVEVDATTAGHLLADVRQILADLSLTEQIRVELD